MSAAAEGGRRTVERADELVALGAATLGESGARLMPRGLGPIWPGATVAAPALPVRCAPGDNLAVHVAVATAPRGSCLLVTVGDAFDRGYWGEVLTTGAMARGITGLVLDGGVRDVDALERLGFPVFARAAVLRGATKCRPGSVGLPVTVAGVVVEQGDWVVGDADGVVVVPGDRLDAVLDAARARAAKEQTYFEALRSGETTVSLLSLDASLVEVVPPEA